MTFNLLESDALFRVGLATENPGHESDDEDSLSSRFVHRLLTHLMRGLKAKDKNIRMRVCQLIAESISAIQDIEWVEDRGTRSSFFLIIRRFAWTAWTCTTSSSCSCSRD